MRRHVVRDGGFEQFGKGTLGNAGQNMYVSRRGVLQRIFYSDVTGNGFPDIPFGNSHDDDCRVPAYVYTDPLHSTERHEVPTDGAFAGAIGDLTGDGHDDLVIANKFDGGVKDTYAQIYFGSPDGYSNRRMLQLWAPDSTDVVIADFDGDGRPELAFVTGGRVRIFVQDERGFRSNGFYDLEVTDLAESIAAADLDNDGHDELVVRFKDESIRVYWGGSDGIDPTRHYELDNGVALAPVADELMASTAGCGVIIHGVPVRPRLKIVHFRQRPHLFLSQNGFAVFVPFDHERRRGEPYVLPCPDVVSAAVGDLRGNGHEDLVLVTRAPAAHGGQQSWIYWDDTDGHSASRRTAIDTMAANDVLLVALDGSQLDIVICQDKTTTSYSTESLIYRLDSLTEPIRLETHCALDVLPTRTGGLIFINHVANSILGDINSFIYLGGPDGYQSDRRIELPGWAATEIKACDFDDDGYVDLYLANSNENDLKRPHGSYIYHGGPDGFSSAHRTELATHNNMSGCVADLNRNGYLDLVVSGWGNSEILLFPGSADGFEEPQRIKLTFDGQTYNQPRYMTLADLNRNGWLDLVIPECGPRGDLIILWGGPHGFDNGRATLIPAGPTISSRVADLTGDGWPDLVLGGYTGDDPGDRYRSFVYIYWGGPEGFSNARRTQLPANFAADVAVADFNNNGILDIFVANYHGHRTRELDCYLYWGEPGGNYSADNVTRLFQHSACGALALDFNEDGYTDLAIANHKTHGNHPGNSYILWNGPSGFSDNAVTALPTLGTHGLNHMDFGNILDRGPEEYFESRPINSGQAGRLVAIRWTGEVPDKTWVRAQVRWGRTAAEMNLAEWSHWLDANEPIAGADTAVFVQYRLAFGATNSVNTPRITAVELIYESLQ